MIVTKTPENDLIFTYNNPDGSSINPSLKGILQEAASGVPIIDLETKQQWNDYDCGPITIDNLVKVVNGEPIKSNLTENSAKEYGTKLHQEHAEVIQIQKQRERNQQQKVNEQPIQSADSFTTISEAKSSATAAR